MSKNLEKTYNPKEIEPKLYEKWCENKYFHAEVDRYTPDLAPARWR